MANLYIMYEDYINKSIVKEQYKIIAETEFHWTIKRNNNKGEPRTVNKASPGGYQLTIEQAYKVYWDSIDKNIRRCLRNREGYIDEMRRLEEEKESLLKL